MSELKNKPSESFKFSDIITFIRSRLFGYNLIRIGIFLLLLWLLHSLLLNIYTNHGQKLKMTNYIGQTVDKVIKMAAAKDYELVIADSVHLIGKPGGYVLNQIPRPNSYVKRGRKVYLIVSRYKADEVVSDNLPILYGEKFEFKRQEFESLFQIKLKISGTKYDPGPIGHILEVKYKGELLADEKSKKLGVLISKGDTLEVVVSVNEGGEIELPNLRCKTVAEAKFEIEASSLGLGSIINDEEIENLNEAYIIKQVPEFQKGKKIKMNSSINITVSMSFPDDCGPQ